MSSKSITLTKQEKDSPNGSQKQEQGRAYEMAYFRDATSI